MKTRSDMADAMLLISATMYAYAVGSSSRARNLRNLWHRIVGRRNAKLKRSPAYWSRKAHCERLGKHAQYMSHQRNLGKATTP